MDNSQLFPLEGGSGRVIGSEKIVNRLPQLLGLGETGASSATHKHLRAAGWQVPPAATATQKRSTAMVWGCGISLDLRTTVA